MIPLPNSRIREVPFLVFVVFTNRIIIFYYYLMIIFYGHGIMDAYWIQKFSVDTLLVLK